MLYSYIQKNYNLINFDSNLLTPLPWNKYLMKFKAKIIIKSQKNNYKLYNKLFLPKTMGNTAFGREIIQYNWLNYSSSISM